MNSDLISQAIKCPKCGTIIKIEGFYGEKKYVTCSNCNTKGVFRFKDENKVRPTTPGSFAIEVRNLTKNFNGLKAVDNFSMSVKKGEVFGFLGPNGAGKTTTLKAMLGLIHMTSGEIKISGFNINGQSIEARKNIGFLPERVSFYDNLTPIQTLNFFCELRGVDKSIIKPLLKEVGLEDAMNRKVGTFSKGMVQLLGIAQVLIGNPSVYILDEPMSGLDARWAKIVRDKIKMLNERGATVLFSSHNMAEVQNLCDRVAVINKGKFIAEDTIANLSKYLNIRPQIEITIPGLNGKIPEQLSEIQGVEVVNVKGDKLFMTCDSSIRSTVITKLEEAGFKISDIKTIEPSLEDTFIKLIEGGV